MRHGMAGRKFGRTSSHRKAMFANMATELLRHEQIRTTLPKAKDLRRVVEPLITLARNAAGTDKELAARRQILQTVNDEAVVKKMFSDLSKRFAKRAGGYTRVIKTGFRQGDAAPMAIIELTELADMPESVVAKTTESQPVAEPKKAKAEKVTSENVTKE